MFSTDSMTNGDAVKLFICIFIVYANIIFAYWTYLGLGSYLTILKVHPKI